MTHRYVALLRGINVGGNNLIRMADLRACFADHGFEDVTTYIQSGNVVFAAERASEAELTQRIEGMLASSFAYNASVVLRSATQMRAVVAGAPEGYGSDPAGFRYDVIFLKAPLTARAAIAEVPIREGVDRVHAGRGVLYHSRVASRASGSRISRVASMPIYQHMTLRNWNTTRKLAELASPTP